VHYSIQYTRTLYSCTVLIHYTLIYCTVRPFLLSSPPHPQVRAFVQAEARAVERARRKQGKPHSPSRWQKSHESLARALPYPLQLLNLKSVSTKHFTSEKLASLVANLETLGRFLVSRSFYIQHKDFVRLTIGSHGWTTIRATYHTQKTGASVHHGSRILARR
jgi:hypothetical protein